ncbi:hypothetical protein GDO78_016263 [Eleutherodactylus coqui]|uniref:Uncharacterized protein n=1 Tax=Eleutherodactylus coqui TaxID=57060 RepID=A0A8J6B6K9_ELECQ|nr:hypothetical protein GDO78_016263 [Eleutherodactylus coqui]
MGESSGSAPAADETTTSWLRHRQISVSDVFMYAASSWASEETFNPSVYFAAARALRSSDINVCSAISGGSRPPTADTTSGGGRF